MPRRIRRPPLRQPHAPVGPSAVPAAVRTDWLHPMAAKPTPTGGLLGTCRWYDPPHYVSAPIGVTKPSPLLLIAECHELARLHLQSALTSVEGWRVAAFADGLTLLAEIDRMTPALVVLALDLSSVSGLGVYRALRRSPATRHTPILFVTDACVIIERARLEGPHACIPPWSERDLLIARVRALLGDRRV